MLITLLCGGSVRKRKASQGHDVLRDCNAARLHLRELRERELTPLERLVEREGQREDDGKGEKRPINICA